MTPEIVGQLLARMEAEPRHLTELCSAAAAAGSAWSEEQVALLLACLPDVILKEDRYHIAAKEEDPLIRALLAVATPQPVPAPVLLRQFPRGVVATAAALCQIARKHSDLELVGGNRIRRR